MKDIKLNAKDIVPATKKLLEESKPYIPYIVVALIVVVYAGLLINIRLIAGREPSEEAIAESLSQIKQPKVDEDTVERLQQLKDQNVQVQALFDQARDNPFE